MSSSTISTRVLRRSLAVGMTAVLALGAIVVGASVPATAAVPYTVTGKVMGVPSAGATPVALGNIEVSLVHQLIDGYYVEVDTARTDSTGNYSVAADAEDAARPDWSDSDRFSIRFNCSYTPGNCSLDYVVSYLGNTPSHRDASYFPLNDSTPTAVKNFTLAGGASISGVVEDSAGVPLVDASISVARAGDSITHAFGRTDANGAYTARQVWPGAVTVGSFYSDTTYPWKPDRKFYQGRWWDNAPSAAAATPLNLASAGSATGIDFTIPVDGAIRGQVVDAAGKGIAEINYARYTQLPSGKWLAPQSGPNLTDANGYFAFAASVGVKYKLQFFDSLSGQVPPGARVPYKTIWIGGTDQDSARVFAPTSVEEVQLGTIPLTVQSSVLTKVDKARILDTDLPSLFADDYTAVSPVSGTHSVIWFRNGVQIAGATERIYRLTAADDGATITYRDTVTLGGNTVVLNSLPYPGTGSEADPDDQPAALAAQTPTVSGTARVGLKLTAKTGDWGQPGIAFTYKWLRNGVSISGATAASYTLTASDYAKTLSVLVSGTKPGFSPAASTSMKTSAVAKGIITAKTPTISGTARVGKTLRATAGTWAPSGVTKTFQWYNNGKKITRATASTYKLPSAAKGDKITVKVSGKKSNYTTKTTTSKSVTVKAKS